MTDTDRTDPGTGPGTGPGTDPGTGSGPGEARTGYDSAVAVIGMSGRFPGAGSVEALWADLRAGRPGLRELTDEELEAAGIDAGTRADPRYVRVGGPVPDPDLFDAGVFGMSAREAMTTDPQHRLFLESSWEALEAAGYCPTDLPGSVGVFAGCGFPDYLTGHLMPMLSEPGGALLVAVGNERDSLASLVSYKLGLRGPAVAVQTFCSTSLVAVHLACQSLLTYECDLALAGGAYVPLPQPSGYRYEQGGILSPDGRVRSFDAGANGTVMGSGVGVVALKRMAEALDDGDVVHAVILGSAVNNDGRARAGYTAPGVEGEAEVIELALGVAGVKPDTVGYVECHATGTSLGDSIELAALGRVFAGPRATPCVLGTLKPSIGHLDRASGVTALIRAALSLEHELLPGTLNYATPNQALADARDRFTVLDRPQPWPAGGAPRRAGVSSFGLGGTNAHVVLEQAPAREPAAGRPGPHLLAFSALDAPALDELTVRLRDHLATCADADLADVAHTLQVSRGTLAQRRAMVVRDRADALSALADPGRWIDARTTRRDPSVRLTPAPGVPAAWWQQLHAWSTGAPGGAADPAAAQAAFADRLAALGVRVTGAGTVPGRVVEELTVGPVAGEPADAWALAALARLWQAGAAITWGALHGDAARRVQLPGYPFQRRRYWVERGAGPAEPAATGRTFDRSRWTYLPTWHQRPLPTHDLAARAREAGPWLVLAGDARGEALAGQLRAFGAQVALARPGPRAGSADDGTALLPPGDAEALTRLVRGLPVPPRAVVHAFSLAPAAAGAAPPAVQREHGLYSVLALARALVDDTGRAPRTHVTVLTSGAVHVAGDDLTCPEHAAAGALAPTLAQENPGVLARHVDVDACPPGREPEQASAVLAAVLAGHEGPMAVRAGEPWQRSYRPHPLPDPGTTAPPVRAGETVLVTGGLGDVGLTLARRFAALGCNLALTVRTPLPPRRDWPALLADPPADAARAVRHVRSVLELEAAGARVLARSADVADRAAMARVLAEVGERFGRVDVVVHAAGVQDARYFAFAHVAGRDVVEAHLASKVGGFQVLQEVLGAQAPDRRFAVSSLSAVLGGLTLGPYAAANAALDAYAAAARRAGRGRWLSVDWDTWGVDRDRVAGHSADVADFAMAPGEAVDVFERTMVAGADLARLVVSTGPVEPRVRQWVIDDLHAVAEGRQEGERHPRPELSTPFVEPAPGVQARLADLWSAVLAVEPIGAHDNFFELGGHSLLAIELTHRIRHALDVALPVTGLVQAPSVQELADLIAATARQAAGDRP